MKNWNKIEIVGSVKSIHVCDVGKRKKVTACVVVQRKDEPLAFISVETWDSGCAGIRAGETVMVTGRVIIRKYVRNDGSVGVMFGVFANKVDTVAGDTPHRADVSLAGLVGRVWNTTAETSLSLATNYVYKDSEGYAVIETTWHMVSVLKGTDGYEAARGLLRGDQTAINGSLRAHAYVNADGNECVRYEVVADSITKIIPVEDQ